MQHTNKAGDMFPANTIYFYLADLAGSGWSMQQECPCRLTDAFEPAADTTMPRSMLVHGFMALNVWPPVRHCRNRCYNIVIELFLCCVHRAQHDVCGMHCHGNIRGSKQHN